MWGVARFHCTAGWLVFSRIMPLNHAALTYVVQFGVATTRCGANYLYRYRYCPEARPAVSEWGCGVRSQQPMILIKRRVWGIFAIFFANLEFKSVHIGSAENNRSWLL